MHNESRIRRTAVSRRSPGRRPAVLGGALLAAVAAFPVCSFAVPLVVDSSAGNSPYTPTSAATYTGITVGDTGTGVLNAPAYSLTSSTGVVIGNAAGSTGTYNLSGSGALTNTGTTSATRTFIGYNGNGTLNQTGGTFTSGPNTDIEIGHAVGSTGTYTMSGGTADLSFIFIGYKSSGSLNVTGGTLNASGFAVGQGAVGTFTLGGTGTVNTTDYVYVGFFDTGSTGSTFTVSGGTLDIGGGSGLTFNNQSNGATGTISGGIVNVGGSLTGNRNTGLSTLNVSGGAVSVDTFTEATQALGVGNLNLSGGSFTVRSEDDIYGAAGFSTIIGVKGTSTVNQTGGSMTVQALPVMLAQNAGSSGTYVLTNGTFTTVGIVKGEGTGTFNFNGGTLVAGLSSTTFMTGLTAANVQAGGALINTNGFDDTIGQALLAGSTGGGLTKLGIGTLTLTGANTYTGMTTVTGGTLATGTTGTLGTGDVSVAAILSLGNAASIADTATLSFTDSAAIVLNSAGGSETVRLLFDMTTNKYALPGTYTSAQLNAFFGDSVYSSLNGQTLTVLAVPEPASLMMAGLAVGGLVIRRRRAATVTD